jgi:dTDP-4-dehydrorhamnose reductase
MDSTFAINAQGAGHVADWCREAGKGLVYVSTDHVFGQAVKLERAQPWRETDIPEPVSVYAKSKRAGELETLEKCPGGHVVRTCGLYGLQPTLGKGNFVQTMLRLASQRPLLRVVDDQWCTPSSAKDVAQAIIALIDSPHFTARGESPPSDRIWHITNTGSTTWANLAREIFRLKGLATQVESITTAQFNAPAARPPYSVLDTSRFTTHIAPLRNWRMALADYLGELSAEN